MERCISVLSLAVLAVDVTSCTSGRCPLKTYITENLVGLAGTNGILLFRVASPLVQVGAVEDVAQHVLAVLGHLVSNNVGWEVDLGLALMVVLLVEPL